MSMGRNFSMVCLLSAIILIPTSSCLGQDEAAMKAKVASAMKAEVKAVVKVKAGIEMNGTWREKTATRDRFCLNGEWDFHSLPGDKNHHWHAEGAISDVDGFDWDMKLRVPGTWKRGGPWYHEYQFLSDADALKVKDSLRAWYRREFFVPAEWNGKNIVLEFGGIGYKAKIFINGKDVGGHLGGFTPFEIDVTKAVKLGQANEILIFNTSFKRDWTTPREGTFKHIDNYSGIWGDVYLRANSKVFIDDVFVKTSVRKGKLTSTVEILNRDNKAHTVNIESVVVDGDKTVLTLPSKQKVTIPPGEMVKVEIEKDWAKPRYWSTEDPHLYFLKTNITEAGKEVDGVSTRFGFREFWVDGKDFRLNGKIIRLKNFPILAEGLASMRPEWIRGWYKLMKDKLNHNSIRFQQFYPQAYIDIADEVGLVIEDGTGFVGGDHTQRWNWPESKVTNKKETTEWVRSRRNNPSIVIWSTNNECWSMLDVKKYRDGDPVAIGIYNWLLGIRDWITEHDDSRVITYHHVGAQFNYTKAYFEEHLEAGDMMGKVDHYNVHYPIDTRYTAEQVEFTNRWSKEKNKPLIIGEFGGPSTGIPCNKSFFLVGGEIGASHNPADKESSYYYFRRVAGGWRAAGVSGIFGWYPDRYCVKTALRNHQFQWDDLTTPGPKPKRVLLTRYNPGWDKSKPEYTPDNAPGVANNRHWELLRDTFAPLLIQLSDNYWEHNYLSGEKPAKVARIVNDTSTAQSVTWSWSLQENGKQIDGDSKTIELAQGEITPINFDVQLPTVTSRKELKLLLKATAGAELESKDALDITVYPTEAVTPPIYPRTRIVLYDTVGKTAEILDKLGIRYRKIDGIARGLKIGRHKVLIIGCDSADASLQGTVMDIAPINVIEHIQKFTASGGKVIVFEQGRETYNNLNLLFSGITTPKIDHGPTELSYHACTYADVAAPGHPIFEGLKSGISFWKGESGKIAEFHYPRPFGTNSIPLLFSAKWSSSLIEGAIGKGRYLMCQTNVTTRYGKDPEATILMHNLLKYAITSAPAEEKRAASLGQIGKILGKFTPGNLTKGFTADDITSKLTETDLSKYKVLILGRDTLTADSEAAGSAEKIMEFVKAGGTVFALPQNIATFKADWLGGKVGIREMKTQYVFKEKSTDQLLWGLSAFDLTSFHHYTGGGAYGMFGTWANPKVTGEFYNWSNDWTSLLLVSKEPKNWSIASKEEVGGIFPTGGSALLARKYGKGKIYLCQLNFDQACGKIEEEVFEDMAVFNLSPRLVADVFLTNLGVRPAGRR